jgi:uncharacterized membrane protein
MTMRRHLAFARPFAAICALAACNADSAVQPEPIVRSARLVVAAAPPSVELVSTTPLALPSEHLTRGESATATDVNDAGTIVGWALTNIRVGIATVWTNGAPRFLGFIGGPYTRAQGISDNGRYVAGQYGGESFELTAAWWKDGTFQQLTPGIFTNTIGAANAVNDQGLAVGSYTTSLPPFPQQLKATLWNGPVETDLLAGQSLGTAFDINNIRQVVGRRTEGAFLWQNGVVTALPGLAPNDGQANAINESGVIVGSSSGTAVRWKNGAIEALPGIPAGGATATDVNEYGQIVGFSSQSGGFFWQEGTGVIQLVGNPLALNNRGIVVGSSGLSATVWTLNFGPVARLTGPDEAKRKDVLTFSAATSSDQNLDALTYAWDFGDGSTGTGATVTHSYNKQDTYTVTVTVSDPRGLTSSASLDVSVENGKKPKKEHDNNGNGNGPQP